jgi:DNA ligase-1
MIPMLANPLEIGNPKHANQWERVQGYWMEYKLDGWRLLLEFQKGKLVHAWTRAGRDILDRFLPSWVEEWPNMGDTILDCEIGYVDNGVLFPIMDYNLTQRVLGSGPQVARSKMAEQQKKPLAFVFDAPIWWGKDITSWSLETRRLALIDEDDWHYTKYPHATLSSVWVKWDERIYDRYVRAGGEGVMLKNPKSTYQPGARPTQTWYKVKKFDTMDVIVTGVQWGQGKYKDQVGAIEFVNPVTGISGKCSGMTDEMRASFTMNADALGGRWMEVRYFGLTAGTPRHPQFVRMRPDRD